MEKMEWLVRLASVRSLSRTVITSSDARIIMGGDKASLIRLWEEKRSVIAPEDLSGELPVQLDIATKHLNRDWFERNTGQRVTAAHRRVRHSAISWMVACLDGVVEASGAIFESKFLPSSFTESTAVKEHMARVQHNMWVTHARSTVLSIITGDGKWVALSIPLDPLYLSILVPAEKKFWRCVQSGERPHLTYREVPRAAASSPVRIVDMSGSSAWAELARVYRVTHNAVMANEKAKRALAALIPAHADQAIGHGVQARRIAGDLPQFELNRGPAFHTPNSYQRRSLARRSSWAARPVGQRQSNVPSER